MYCSGCGKAVDPRQQVCSECGKAVAGAPMPVGGDYPPVQVGGGYGLRDGFRVQRHFRSLGYVWIAYACWSLLQVAVIAAVFTGMSGIFGRTWIDPMSFWTHFPFYGAPWLVPLITIVTVGRAILSGAAGVALLSRQPWGRTLALVAAFLTILKPLTGTAVAVYTFWVLFPAASRAEYDALALPAE